MSRLIDVLLARAAEYDDNTQILDDTFEELLEGYDVFVENYVLAASIIARQGQAHGLTSFWSPQPDTPTYSKIRKLDLALECLDWEALVRTAPKGDLEVLLALGTDMGIADLCAFPPGTLAKYYLDAFERRFGHPPQSFH